MTAYPQASAPVERKIYGEWNNAAAAKRVERAGSSLDPSTLQQALIAVHGVNGNDYLVRGHLVRDQYGRWQAITARRDGKMQMSLGSNPGGYQDGVDCFCPNTADVDVMPLPPKPRP